MVAFDDWVGRTQDAEDHVSPEVLRRLAALLDHDSPPWRDAELPPLGHWLFHLGAARQSALDTDGHPRRGDFLPPVPLPRRMWVGSEVRFLHPVAVNAHLKRHSTITGIDRKSGRSGELTLVTVSHRIKLGEETAIEEEQHIAYLTALEKNAPSAQPRIAVPEARSVRRMQASSTLLFRFSALTFNAHRIHYDRNYASNEEHYPGLVVHGPLLATLLMDHFLRSRPGTPIASFSFRARAPLYEGEAFELCMGGPTDRAQLWVAGSEGGVRMTAQVRTAG